MKISLIGHGLLPIPPTGHGAVESLIADYSFHLKALGHNVQIVNVRGADMAKQVNSFAPDVVWLHDDKRISQLSQITAAKKIVTTHDPQLLRKQKWKFPDLLAAGHDIYCLSQKQMNWMETNGVEKSRIFFAANGARS